MRITNLVSGTIGLISGAVGVAVPLICKMSPLNSLATGTFIAISAGFTTYSLWDKHGKRYFAEYLAKQVDNTIHAHKDSIRQMVTESVKDTLPTMIGSACFVEDAIQSVINSCLDDYVTDPQVVFKVLDEIDRGVPYEKNPLLNKFAKQTADSIIDAKLSTYTPFRSYLRKPLKRIIATIAANFLIKTTEVAITKVKNSSTANVVNKVEKLLSCDLYSSMTSGLGLA